MLDQKRQLEIARGMLKLLIRQKDVRLDANDFKRDLHSTSKTLGIPAEEVGEFLIPLLEEMVDDMFERGEKFRRNRGTASA